MHRTIGYLSKRLVQIRAGEGRKVLWTFLYFFLVITAYYVIKPVSRSLVLGDLGSRLVPLVDLISALLMGPMVALFARLVDRVEKRRLVSFTLLAVAANLLAFWKLLSWPTKWMAAAFYVWVAIFSVLVVTLFWLVANDLYHLREAKRLFGFIGSGGILGGVAGSSIAATGAHWFGTEQLLLWSVAILLVCWLVVQRLWRYAPTSLQTEGTTKPERQSNPLNLGGIARLVFSSRYLVLLVGLVGIAKIISTFIYYQFNPFIEQMFPDQDAKTAFTGLFFGWVNIASFLIQFFLTSWMLRRLGLAFALLALPIGLLGGSIALLAMPMFWIAATTELFDASMNYSLQQTTKEVLYLPIERSVRYKVKPFIDMVVFRFGKGIAAVIGIVLLNVLHLEARVFGYLTIPLVVAWIILAMQIRHDYVKTIRGILQARAASRRRRDLAVTMTPQPVWPVAELEELEERFESLALGNPAHRKLILASQLFATNGALAEGADELLEELARYEQRPTIAEAWELSPSFERLKECLQDRHEPMAARRYAIKQLIQRDGQDAVDCLLGMLMVEEDAVMRREILRGLTKLRLRSPRLEFPRRLIRRQIAKEAQACQRVVQVAAIYRQASPLALQREADPILELLRTLTEETAQQIFRLLSLIYRPEDIYLIYNQLREPDAYVRADAIELLDNLIDPGLRWLIFPVLDENRFLERMDSDVPEPLPEGKEVYERLQRALWDHNRWLSIVTICLIGRLRVEPLLPELDRVAQSKVPLLERAAKIARHLAATA